MTDWREFRPQSKLLHANFDGYRLTLEPLAQYSLQFDANLHVQKDVELNNDIYTYNGIKGFRSLNQLHVDNEMLYFVDQTHSIQQVNVCDDQSLSHLQQPTSVYQLPRTTLHASMFFLGDSLACVCDGRSKVLLLGTNSPKWKLVHEEELDEFVTAPIRLLHAVTQEGFVHAVLGFLQTDCQLLWVTFSRGASNEMKLVRRRTLTGKKWPDFIALESNGQAIYMVAEGLHKFTFDSQIEVKPEEAPKQLVLEKIDSPLQYTWSQTYTTIELEIDSKTAESQQWSVLIESDHLKCSVNDTLLINAKLTEKVDPKESSYTITKEKSNQLTITLHKTKIGSFWSEVFTEGQAISGDIKMIEQPGVNVSQDDDDEVKQPYNSQQLEECDQYSNETDTFLVRVDGDTHRITHQALLYNQILFTKLDPPLLCIRHDVDGLIWQMNSITSNDQAPWSHEATLNAFGYVQASKQNRKFLSTPADYSYALISDLSTHLYLYKQQSPASNLPGSSLRNRKTGKLVESVAKQHMISLENRQEILGLITANERIYILTENQLSIIAV